MFKKSSTAVKLMRWIHQWLGLFTGVLLFFVVVTATYLAGNGVVSGITKTFVSAGVPVGILSAQEKAVYTHQLFEKYPKAKSLTFPTESVPYFEMFKSGGRVLIDKNLEVIDNASSTASNIRRFMFFMHRNFFLSKVGAQINATMSIVTVALSIIGIVLLVPIWRSVKLKHAVPKNTKRASLIRSHQLLGLFIFVPLVVAALTGAALTWRDTTNNLLSSGVNFTDKKRVQKPPASIESLAILVQQQWPDKKLLNVFKRGSRKGKGAAYSFRFETSGFKWLDGFDTISVSYPKVRNITFSEFATLPINEQIRGLIRSLHDGLRMPLIYEMWLFLTMLLSSYVIGSSMFSFTRSLVKRA